MVTIGGAPFDEDTTPATLYPTEDAFKAFAAAIAPMYRCGGYGSGWLLDQLYDAVADRGVVVDDEHADPVAVSGTGAGSGRVCVGGSHLCAF